MTDSTDDQERGMPSEIDEATEAFEALRRTVEKLARDLGGEMVVIRKGVEAAFERFETFQQPTDHSVDIGQIAESLVLIGKHLTVIQKSPALKNGPEHYARVIEIAADRISANAVRTLENRERGLHRVEADIRDVVSGVRDRRQQDRWLLVAAAVGMVMGGVFLALGPRLLPGSIDKAIAATVMNADRWDAGIALMQSASPEGWRGIADASALVRANQQALTTCAEAAAKAKSEQRCVITVAVPASDK
ncbi:DUF6118 family protein [Rhizobium sp. VS19-DR104.2]|uniref:DUF6118 family protein n=1 Tax=unclassified Rhizobium TaxID=2613769 RepID=UPI001CC3BBCE|nr:MULTISPECIES: DUF6118 family protein [unclassified Rhizobium]MBZ5763848.1 DUF6118 family protein [Rhizobium sp. VS19-DR96]MBZ5769787.1 DUF6118 family protein [Rhizobium sp. VS19-DR129.2]MBZ5777327.1 DUF6118 family protein [Rhizobium sp. VS19-DRK62.2]MBZ5788104.1 DUF6118 family protein [Rhizobium sp. VS19-DR121]MBZ5805893.1 DUF6118 family protein [Rhizobium sp. VS19-DR181]